MLDYLKDVRKALYVALTDHVYRRCVEKLQVLREERYKLLQTRLESFWALLDTLDARLTLDEHRVQDSPSEYFQNNTGPTADEVAAVSLLTANNNSVRNRARRTRANPTEGTGMKTAPAARTPDGRSEVQDLSPLRQPDLAGCVSCVNVGNSAHHNVEHRSNSSSEFQAPTLTFDPRYRRCVPRDLTRERDVCYEALPITPFGELGPLEPGFEPVTSLITKLSLVIDYRMYRLDNVSRTSREGTPDASANTSRPAAGFARIWKPLMDHDRLRCCRSSRTLISRLIRRKLVRSPPFVYSRILWNETLNVYIRYI